MIKSILRLFARKPKPDLGALINAGALIIDVRTPSEYASGHLKNSINIPVDLVQHNLAKIGKDKPVITCCASGMRSGVACRLLKTCGYPEVYNGGSWTDLRKFEK